MWPPVGLGCQWQSPSTTEHIAPGVVTWYRTMASMGCGQVWGQDYSFWSFSPCACFHLWLTLLHLINDWHKNVHPGLQSSVVATHSLHKPCFPLLSKESLVVIKTKVFMVRLKFFVSSHTKFLIVVVSTMVIWDTQWSHSRCSVKTCGTNMTAVLSGVPCLEGAFLRRKLAKAPKLLNTSTSMEPCLELPAPQKTAPYLRFPMNNCIRLRGEVAMILCSPRTETAWASLPTVPSSWAPSPT